MRWVKLAIGVVFLATLRVNATTWYIQSGATGLNNGTSWANAWKEMDQPNWASVAPGDTVQIGGGTYYAALVPTCAGNASLQTVIRASQEAGHNSRVILNNFIQYTGNYVTITGAKADLVTNLPPTQIWWMTNNINWEVNCTNFTAINIKGYLGQKLLWMEVSGAGTYLMNITGNPRYHGIAQNYTGVQNITGCEIGYCWSHNVKSDSFNMNQNSGMTWGDIKIHHCIASECGDDNFQLCGGCDLSYSFSGYPHPTHYEGHPDAVATSAPFIRIYNNFILPKNNSWVYAEAFPELTNAPNIGGGWLVYGNICFTNVYSPANGLSFGTQWRSGRSDGYRAFVDPFVVVNNTILGGNQQGIKNWYTAPITNFVVSNSFVVNNLSFDQGRAFQSNNVYNISISTYGRTYMEYNVASGWSPRVSWFDTQANTGGNYGTGESLNSAQGFTGNSSVIPLFKDSANYNYSPATNDTVLVNKGVNLTTYLPAYLRAVMPDYDIDLNYTPRGTDAGWDIGAFEGAASGTYTPPSPGTNSPATDTENVLIDGAVMLQGVIIK